YRRLPYLRLRTHAVALGRWLPTSWSGRHHAGGTVPASIWLSILPGRCQDRGSFLPGLPQLLECDSLLHNCFQVDTYCSCCNPAHLLHPGFCAHPLSLSLAHGCLPSTHACPHGALDGNVRLDPATDADAFTIADVFLALLPVVLRRSQLLPDVSGTPLNCQVGSR